MKRNIRRNVLVLLTMVVMLGSMLGSSLTTYAAGGSYSYTFGKTSGKTTLDEAGVDALMLLTELELMAGFGDNYSISRKDDLVTINIWTDGMAECAAAVQLGLISRKEWTTSIQPIQDFSKTMYDCYSLYGAHVNVNVLNDLNTDNVLLCYLDGLKIFDATE